MGTRTALAVAPLCLAVHVLGAQTADPARPPFEEWLSAVRLEAVSRGISEDVVSRAFDGIEPLPIVVTRDQTQAEFTLSLDKYLAQRITRQSIRLGKASLARYRDVLRHAQSDYGIDPATLVAVWGIESNFGRFTGVRPTVAALATLAYEPRRASYFREELFDALEILNRGDIDLPSMKGSWAGAMGQPQFMPSSYLEYAVDRDGDQKKDIWNSPADIFGSIANYLKAHGWTKGERWGRKVVVPAAAKPGVESAIAMRQGGCRAIRELSEPLPLQRWSQLGVRLPGNRPLPASTMPASLLRVDKQSYLVYRNYDALLGYNCAHAYALSVALLAERIAAR
jgi:membrane-bound lytic murein transglycosylase B